MLKNIFLLVCLCLLASAGKAQKQTWRKEINQQIWIPFTEAYGALDAKKYQNLHTKDLIRATGDGSTIKDLQEYMMSVGSWFADLKHNGQKLEITFRFLERLSNGKTASERGIYELSLKNAAGETQKIYGKFHVFLRKAQGRWKIAIDYDSSEGGTIDQKAFEEGFAIDNLEK